MTYDREISIRTYFFQAEQENVVTANGKSYSTMITDGFTQDRATPFINWKRNILN